MLNDKGGFHPALLASFISAVGLYPAGNAVVLSDGSKGIVNTVGTRIDRPRVQLTHDSRGDEIPPDDQQLINLAAGEHKELFVAELLQGLVE
jgi:uncharacterized protein involved in tellurium resistance